jgi:NADH:ubiquinone oxidoreductase subunit F (NADH-binding)
MIHRVLDPSPCRSLADHRAAGGGRGLAEAVALGPEAIVACVEAAGLRGRGGAGFPTGTKWRTVAAASSAATPTPVVVNAAEGEPGTFKDRTLLRRNPYRVLEGALIAAVAMGSHEVVVATKASFAPVVRALERAIAELAAAPLVPGIEVRLALGPDAYLFGEETALLEVIEGRQPFPRVTPPYRRGLDEAEAHPGRNASQVHLAVAGGADEAPALVDNVETLANVPGILAEGPDHYREVGTEASPGTVVCTVTGHTARHGVGEFAMGTPLADIVAELGGGPRPGRRLVAVAPGVSNALLPADRLGTPASYEAMAEAGSGLGSAGFIVFDDGVDPTAVAHAMARFLAVESCGQCEPCKLDGLAIAGALDRLRRSEAGADDLELVDRRLRTVTRGARCSLATQQEQVVGSLLRLFPERVRAHLGPAPAAEPVVIAPLVDIAAGQAVLDDRHPAKQPDWTFDPVDSGALPAARLEDEPVLITTPEEAP